MLHSYNPTKIEAPIASKLTGTGPRFSLPFRWNRSASGKPIFRYPMSQCKVTMMEEMQRREQQILSENLPKNLNKNSPAAKNFMMKNVQKIQIDNLSPDKSPSTCSEMSIQSFDESPIRTYRHALLSPDESTSSQEYCSIQCERSEHYQIGNGNLNNSPLGGKQGRKRMVQPNLRDIQRGTRDILAGEDCNTAGKHEISKFSGHHGRRNEILASKKIFNNTSDRFTAHSNNNNNNNNNINKNCSDLKTNAQEKDTSSHRSTLGSFDNKLSFSNQNASKTVEKRRSRYDDAKNNNIINTYNTSNTNKHSTIANNYNYCNSSINVCRTPGELKRDTYDAASNVKLQTNRESQSARSPVSSQIYADITNNNCFQIFSPEEASLFERPMGAVTSFGLRSVAQKQPACGVRARNFSNQRQSRLSALQQENSRFNQLARRSPGAVRSRIWLDSPREMICYSPAIENFRRNQPQQLQQVHQFCESHGQRCEKRNLCGETERYTCDENGNVQGRLNLPQNKQQIVCQKRTQSLFRSVPAAVEIPHDRHKHAWTDRPKSGRETNPVASLESHFLAAAMKKSVKNQQKLSTISSSKPVCNPDSMAANSHSVAPVKAAIHIDHSKTDSVKTVPSSGCVPPTIAQPHCVSTELSTPTPVCRFVASVSPRISEAPKLPSKMAAANMPGPRQFWNNTSKMGPKTLQPQYGSVSNISQNKSCDKPNILSPDIISTKSSTGTPIMETVFCVRGSSKQQELMMQSEENRDRLIQSVCGTNQYGGSPLLSVRAPLHLDLDSGSPQILSPSQKLLSRFRLFSTLSPGRQSQAWPRGEQFSRSPKQRSRSSTRSRQAGRLRPVLTPREGSKDDVRSMLEGCSEKSTEQADNKHKTVPLKLNNRKNLHADTPQLSRNYENSRKIDIGLPHTARTPAVNQNINDILPNKQLPLNSPNTSSLDGVETISKTETTKPILKVEPNVKLAKPVSPKPASENIKSLSKTVEMSYSCSGQLSNTSSIPEAIMRRPALLKLQPTAQPKLAPCSLPTSPQEVQAAPKAAKSAATGQVLHNGSVIISPTVADPKLPMIATLSLLALLKDKHKRLLIHKEQQEKQQHQPQKGLKITAENGQKPGRQYHWPTIKAFSPTALFAKNGLISPTNLLSPVRYIDSSISDALPICSGQPLLNISHGKVYPLSAFDDAAAKWDDFGEEDTIKDGVANGTFQMARPKNFDTAALGGGNGNQLSTDGGGLKKNFASNLLLDIANGNLGKDGCIDEQRRKIIEAEYDISWEFCNPNKISRLLDRRLKENDGGKKCRPGNLSCSPMIQSGHFSKGFAGSELDRGKLSLNFGLSGLNPKGENIDSSLDLGKQSWYHGAISRVEAENRLHEESEGSYLIRACESNKEEYALSLKSAHGYIHMKIHQTPEARCVLSCFPESFESVPKMVRYYSINKLPIKGAEHMCLLRPVHEQLL